MSEPLNGEQMINEEKNERYANLLPNALEDLIKLSQTQSFIA